MARSSIALLVLLGGCAEVTRNPGSNDFSRPDDGAPGEEGGVVLDQAAASDRSLPGDLAAIADLVAVPDGAAGDLGMVIGADLARPPGADLAAPMGADLAIPVNPDFAVPPNPDLAVPPNADFAVPPNADLASGRPDLAMAIDFAAPPDLAQPRDFAQPRDLAQPPDLARPACNPACVQGCNMAGQCTPAVVCTPLSRRCAGNVVQRCSNTGDAWLAESLCVGTCSGGLCGPACTPGEGRCDGSRRETCAMDGKSWALAENCALGCAQTVCVEAELTNHGNPISLSGIKVYQGCVTVDLGGSIAVPANQTLDITARCIVMSASAAITLGAGATLRVRVSETADLQGTISGGKEVFLQAYKSMTHGGKTTSTKVTLRADTLLNAGTIAGTDTAALYGSKWTNTGNHGGAVSVMPPERLYSSSHPEGLWLNLSGPVDVAWERPFPSALGYYVSVGDTVPGPGKGNLANTPATELAANLFGPGLNRVRVVSVNGDSIVGTYPVDLNLQFNVRPPAVTSMSHPVDTAWGGSKDVFFSWTDPANIPANSWTGYRYVFDRQADTVPTEQSGTVTQNRTLLLPNQANGIWFFHLVILDRLGRPSPLVAHYQVRVGADPGSGNVAGTIKDAQSGQPIAGARVFLNGGLLESYSDRTGDYTFQARVPIAQAAYRVTATAPGYKSREAMVTVANNQTQIVNFQLDPGPAPSGYGLGWEVQVWDRNANSPTYATGPRGRHIFASIGALADEKVQIVRSTGDPVVVENTLDEYYNWEQGTDVGWNGSVFWAIDTYRCGYDVQLNYGQGWSCLQIKAWDSGGAPKGGWLRWRNSGQTGAPSAAWNGTSWGAFFASYDTLYYKDITAAVQYGSGDSINHTALPGTYGDTRQSAWTSAVWDSAGYALAFVMDAKVAGPNSLYFGRYAKNGGQQLAPVAVATSIAGPVSLVFDGTNYHLAYRTGSAPFSLVVRTISPGGQVSAATVVATGPKLSNPGEQIGLAWDKRYLITVHTNADRGTLEARSPADRSVVFKQDLGPMRIPRVGFNPETGEGGVLYLRTDRTGTFLRPFQAL